MMSKKQAHESIANPYLNARREWDERYGDLMTRARNWQRFAAISAAIAGLSVAGIAYIGAQSKIQPFVVVTDQLGSPVAVARPVSTGKTAADQRIVIATLANWVVNARTVTSDAAAQQVFVDRVYAMVSKSVADQLNEWFKTNSPFGRNETVRVEINAVLPQSKDTYQVSWTEVHQRVGAAAVAEKWKALVTVSQSDELAQKPGIALWNPFGLYIKELSWTKEIG